jgi:hypothetical protein
MMATMTLDTNNAHAFDIEIQVVASDFVESLTKPNTWVYLLRGAEVLTIQAF